MTTYDNTPRYTAVSASQEQITNDQGACIGYKVAVSFRNDSTGITAKRTADVYPSAETLALIQSDITEFTNFIETNILSNNLIHLVNQDLEPQTEES